MDKLALFYASIAFTAWGFTTFFDKLAANKLGNRGTMIVIVSLIVGFISVVFFYIWGGKWGLERSGTVWFIVSYILNAIGFVAFYLLIVRSELSLSVVLTSLYPALSVILAFIFLKESITVTKFIGISLAMIAVFLLSK